MWTRTAPVLRVVGRPCQTPRLCLSGAVRSPPGGAVSPASAVACGRRAAHQVTTSCPVYKRKGAFAFISRGNVRSLHPGLCGTCMPFNV